MTETIRDISKALQRGEDVMLVTVVASSGSTPREEGARMAVFGGEGFSGTIGGGALEYRAQGIARELLGKKECALRDFSLSNDNAADLGMICGGDVTVHFQYVPNGAETQAFFARASELCESDGRVWTVTCIDENGGWAMHLMDKDKNPVVSCGKSGLPLPSSELCGRGVVLVESEGVRQFAQPAGDFGRVFIFGGGHISQCLVPLLKGVFFSCTVVDSDGLFANRERFPLAADILVLDFDSAFKTVRPGPEDYIVILTRGHLHDYSVLAQALRTQAHYIGMVGSRGKIDACYQKLIVADGFGMADIRRVNAPIGLPIGGETPEEIALSITAQIVEYRTKRLGSDTKKKVKI